jgi:hypothetical protein
MSSTPPLSITTNNGSISNIGNSKPFLLADNVITILNHESFSTENRAMNAADIYIRKYSEDALKKGLLLVIVGLKNENGGVINVYLLVTGDADENTSNNMILAAARRVGQQIQAGAALAGNYTTSYIAFMDPENEQNVIFKR